MFRQQQHQNYTFGISTVWLVVFLMVPVLASAQVETGKPPSTPFPQQPEAPKKEYTVPPLPLPNPPNPFKVEEREQQKNNLSITPEQFVDPGAQYLKKLNRKGKSNKNESQMNPENFKQDQYLGDFRVGSKRIRVIFRDHEYPDGDRVQILLNDRVVVANILLLQNFKGFDFELEEGFNRIDFVALNQGESGPNTAEVQVYDEAGALQAADRWNLATGVKATYVIVKSPD